MVFKTWSPQETELLVTMLQHGQSYSEISEAITAKVVAEQPGFETIRSSNAVEKKVGRLLDKTVQPVAPPDEDVTTARWRFISETQAKYKEESTFNTRGVLKSAPTKILCLSDIHFPFARMDFLNEAIEKHADADVIVLNGDILDGYIFSTFDKDRSVAAIDEYNCAFDFVHRLSKLFPKVVMTEGNHDARVVKSLKRSGYQDDAYTVFSPSLLARIANGERLGPDGLVAEKVRFTNVYFSPVEPWWIQIGKTIFIHPHSRGSGKPGWTVATWARKFADRLPPGSFDAFVCGHTHKTYKGVTNATLLIEQGCLCDFMSYSWQPREVLSSDAANGYAVIYQDEHGNTDFNTSGFVYLGQLQPVGKPIFGGRDGKANNEA